MCKIENLFSRGFSFYVNIFIFMSHGTWRVDYICNKDMQGIKGKTLQTQNPEVNTNSASLKLEV